MSYYVSEITLAYWEQKITLMEEKAIGTFWNKVQFYFISDRCTVKFLKIKSNPTNKNCGRVYILQSIS